MRNFYLIVFLAVFSVGMWSCKSFEGASVSVKPDPIEVHADSIKYSVHVVVPPKSGMKKGGTYTGEAKIGKYSQGRVVISSAKYPDIKKTGLDTTISFARPYYDDMDGNNLMVVQEYERKGKTFELQNLENLAQCCITTSRLVWENDQFVWSQHDYQKEVPLRLEAKFNFPKDVSEIQEEEFNKADIQAIGDFISNKYPATKITVVGFASPEGPYARNVKLANERSKGVIEWLKTQLKEAGYEEYLDSAFFEVSTTSEDWEGFKASLNASYPNYSSQIADILSAGLTEDEKERQIMALVGGKEKVENLLAPLRRATIVVEGFEPRKTDEEIDQIARQFIDGKFEGELKETFEQEEWLYAISRVEKPMDKKPLLEAFREVYPSDFRAFNDLGIIYLMEGNVDDAVTILEKAQNMKGNNYAVLNNLGVAYKTKKKYKDAQEQYEASLAAKSTPEANFNLGVVLIKMARYSAAVNRFQNASNVKGSNYNIGLAKLLMNDLAGAKQSLEAATKENKDHAWSFYVLSIAGARASDANTMVANLRKAVQLDSKLAAKAKSDLEFRKYWENAEFKTAVN